MSVLLRNNAKSQLASSLTVGATTLSVSPGTGALFPAPTGGDWFPLTLTQASGQVEVVRVTARSADSMTIVRAQDGTAAMAFSAGDKVGLRLTAGAIEQIQTDLAALSAAAASDASTAQTTANSAASAASSAQSTANTANSTANTANATANAALPKAGGTMSGSITSSASVALSFTPGGTERGRLYADSTGVGFANNANAWVMKALTDTLNVEFAGSVSAPGPITETSDVRLKQNIRQIGDALNKVCTLSGYTYEMIDMPEVRRTGVIAQEVQEVLPEAVIHSIDGRMTVAYGNMIGLVIEAVKELARENQSLRNRLDQIAGPEEA